MTISLRLEESEADIVKAYANMHGVSVSELLRKSVLEKIEDEYDLRAFEQALVEYKENPVTYSFEDVVKELGLDV